MFRKLMVFLVILVVLAGCGPTNEELEQQFMQTFAAQPTETEFPATPTRPATDTPAPTPTPQIVDGDCIPNPDQPQAAEVLEVIDSITLRVRTDEGEQRVRYLGLAAMSRPGAPESLGREAVEENRRLVERQVVMLFSDPAARDRANLLLRYVVIEDRFINLQLIQDGYARAAASPVGLACADIFRQHEQRAQSANRGLWPALRATATPRPTTPVPTLPLATTAAVEMPTVVVQTIAPTEEAATPESTAEPTSAETTTEPTAEPTAEESTPEPTAGAG